MAVLCGEDKKALILVQIFQVFFFYLPYKMIIILESFVIINLLRSVGNIGNRIFNWLRDSLSKPTGCIENNLNSYNSTVSRISNFTINTEDKINSARNAHLVELDRGNEERGGRKGKEKGRR